MDSSLKRALAQIWLEHCLDDDRLRIERMDTLYTARCCCCPHIIEVTQFALNTKVPGETARLILVCGGCLRYLWAVAPGFSEVSRKDFKKLPREMREYLERTRALIVERKRMGVTVQ